MLAEAKREGDRILGEAREQAAREASQTEIVKLAERQAQEIVDDARRPARETRLEMEDWADGILSTLEMNLDKGLTAVRRGARAVARASPRRPSWPVSDRRDGDARDRRAAAGGRGALRQAGAELSGMTRFALDAPAAAPGSSTATRSRSSWSRSSSAASATCPCPRARPPSSRSRAPDRTVFELALHGRLHGPCQRCLEDAVVERTWPRASTRPTSPGRTEELRTPYVADDRLDLDGLGTRRARARAARCRSSAGRTAPAFARSAAGTSTTSRTTHEEEQTRRAGAATAEARGLAELRERL